MKLQVELYIDVSGDPTSETPIYRRLDLFDFEEIELTSSVQEVRDIDKVFTDYSRQFSLPASNTNNDIFQHYYNTNIIDGFDARIKQRAYININGITFRDGYIRLSEVVRRHQKPSMYKVVFFGAMVSLKQVLGDLKLSSLSSLSRFNHEYNTDNVYDGFTDGLGLSGSDMVKSSNRDIVYPAISSVDKWFYDSSALQEAEDVSFSQGKSANLYDDGVSSLDLGINHLHLKPAIKVIHIIEAIEDKFSSLSFSRDFFGRSFFNELYLLLHNTKGVLSTSNSFLQEPFSMTFNVGSTVSDSDFDYLSGTEHRPMVTRYENVGFLQYDVQQYHVIPTITPATGQESKKYNIKVLDGDEIIASKTNASGTDDVRAVLCSQEEKTWSNIRIVVETGIDGQELSLFDLTLELRQVRFRISQQAPNICDAWSSLSPDEDSGFYEFSENTIQTITEIDVVQHVPDMTILSFLQGLFKAFNLTSEVNKDGVIVVKTLNTFYDEGDEIDITSYVHTDEDTLSRVKLFDNIKFEFQEPKTFGLKNQNEILQDKYGDLELQLSPNGTERNLAFDGGKYEVKLPFEKLFYERLRDENDLTVSTELGHGWLADDNQSPVLTKPVLFFNVNQSVGTSSYGFIGKSNFNSYNRPSNVTSDGNYSLHFGEEFDEYTGDSITRSLFSLFYSGYITNMYSKNNRMLSLKAHLPLGFLISYKMNDALIIRDKYYIINKIKTNLSTGESHLELLPQYTDIQETPETDTTEPTIPQNVALSLAGDTFLDITWDASTDNVGVTGYYIYGDGDLLKTVGVTTYTRLTGLDVGTTYSITLKAFDASGNESDPSTPVNMTTTADTTNPSQPQLLIVTSVTYESVSLSWSPSSDNVGVVGYDIYRDGVLDGSSFTNSYTSSGLSHSTAYSFKVRAKDAAGNVSQFSLSVTGTTTVPQLGDL